MGAVGGLISQGVSDYVSGTPFQWENYAGAAVGGAVTGALLANFINPALAGAAGNTAGNLVTQISSLASGSEPTFSVPDLVWATGSGAVTGVIPGLPTSNGSWSHVAKVQIRKLYNGTTSSVSAKTLGKITGANLANSVPGGVAQFVAGQAYQNYVDPLIGDFLTLDFSSSTSGGAGSAGQSFIGPSPSANNSPSGGSGAGSIPSFPSTSSSPTSSTAYCIKGC